MAYKSHREIASVLERHLKEVHNKFAENSFYIGLYGSQNYGLDTPESDIDSKCILIPQMRDVVLGKSQINKDIVIPDNGAICTVKDIRGMFDNFYKGNINFTEILFTPYYLKGFHYNDIIEQLRWRREFVALRDIPNLFRMAQGMARQKYVAFDRPFESKKEILAKYHYDAKQLHHIVRLYYFMETIAESMNFESALKIFPRGVKEYLYDIKNNNFSYEVAVEIRDKYMRKIDEFVAENTPKFVRDNQKKIDAEVRDFLDDLAYMAITRNMTLEKLRK